MNQHILTEEAQAYIDRNLTADANKIALAKSPFENVSSSELGTQITAKKKSEKKLPTWFNHKNIYYPPVLSIEQTSSEETAKYKSALAKGDVLVDLTAGFGIDSYYFAKQVKHVYSCEINEDLSEISAHNASILATKNITFLSTDGLEFIKNSGENFDTIYVDPARRTTGGKVFKLAECSPNIVEQLDLLLEKAKRILIKTAPLLDISAGLSELKNVAEIHIVSVKNECKELIWVIDKDFGGEPVIVCATCNKETKIISIPLTEIKTKAAIAKQANANYLYEPDVALMKSGAFDWIAKHYGIHKLENQSHLYLSNAINKAFIGRIFKIETTLTLNEFKKRIDLKGNVIVRNFPAKAENLVRKYRIKPAQDEFIIFSKNLDGYIAIFAKIIQHY